jgi:DNA repair exonuclease SbcCD ATPase subunit
VTLRITSVEVAGLKTRDQGATLAPVQLITGPNGSGKSAVLEAISYALTGHISGVKATELGLLLPDPKTVSVVVQASDESADRTVSVSRGIQSGKKYARGRAFSRASGDSKEAKTTELDSFVKDEFGKHAELFLEAFDPDKNIWSMSAEARLRWTFGMVARASGWTKERLGEVLKKLGHGNPDFGRDVVECLDLNIKTASEWMKSTAKSVREYDAILAGLTDAISEPKPEELAAAQADVKILRDRFGKIQTVLRCGTLRGELVELETRLVAERRAALDMETLRDARRDVVLAEEAEKERIEAVKQERAALRRHHADVAAALDVIGKTGACPTCGAAYVGAKQSELVTEWAEAQAKRAAAIEAASETIQAWISRSSFRVDHEAAHNEAERRLIKLGALDVERTEQKVSALKQEIADLEKDGSFGTMDAAADASVQARLEEAEAKLEEMRGREQIAKERAKKTADRDKAEASATQRRKQHDELCDVRSNILVDARRAVIGAIEDIDHAVAPHGSKWALNISEEAGLDIAYFMKDGSFVRFKAMSSGERIVATVVLLVALRRLIGETPWSALLVDNLELTSIEERLKLVSYVSTLSGLFSNIILLSSDNRPVGNLAVTSFE